MPLHADQTVVADTETSRSVLHRASRFLAIAVFILAPLPFGSVEGPWTLLWIVLLAISLTFADVSDLKRSHACFLLTITGVLMILVVLAMVQTWPHARFADPIWTKAGTLLGQTFEPRPSASAAQPLFALGPPLLFLLALLRAIILGTEGRSYRLALRAIGLAAIVYALYSGMTLASGSTMLLWREKEAHIYNLTGTFTNRNTAATYFGSVAIIWALQSQAQARVHFAQLIANHDFMRSLTTIPRRLLSTAGAALICLGALAATGSRAGLIISVSVLVIAIILYRWPSAQRQPWPPAVWVAIAVGGALLLELWGGIFAMRIELQGLSDAGRFRTYQATLQIIREHPLLGIGLGNFETFFPSVRPETMSSAGIWNRAHSTPLELAAELGLPFMVLAALVSCLIFTSLIRSVKTHRRREIIAGLAVALLGLMHSLFDFSLQIPGYAVTYAALVGIGLSRGLMLESRRQHAAKHAEELRGPTVNKNSPRQNKVALTSEL